MRLPLWALYIDWWGKSEGIKIARLIEQRTYERRHKFCNFIYSNSVSLRNEIFIKLSMMQHVDSYGGVLNNMGYRAADKLQVLHQYRFTLAFENQFSSGYVTEKLLQPLACGSIPIYWGAPEALTDFNPNAFINAGSFDSIQDLIMHVLTIDKNEDMLRRMLEAPIFKDGVPKNVTPMHITDRIEEALDNPRLRAFGK
jgi:hypothetical protein